MCVCLSVTLLPELFQVGRRGLPCLQRLADKVYKRGPSPPVKPPTQSTTHRKRKAKRVYDQLGEQPKIKKRLKDEGKEVLLKPTT